MSSDDLKSETSDDHKSETSVWFELLKWLGIGTAVFTIVVFLIVLNPELTRGLVVTSFLSTPYGKGLSNALDGPFAESDSSQPTKIRKSTKTPNSTITAALGYGEGLTAIEDLGAETIIVPEHIYMRSKFPTAKLGHSSPLGYSSLIGKKTKFSIKRGDFFTTENVEF